MSNCPLEAIRNRATPLASSSLARFSRLDGRTACCIESEIAPPWIRRIRYLLWWSVGAYLPTATYTERNVNHRTVVPQTDQGEPIGARTHPR